MLMVKASRTHHRRSMAEFAKHDISAGQPRILDFLAVNEGCIQRELATKCNLEPASVTSVLSSMEKAGLITRIAVEDDKRALCVWLTDKGREKQKAVRSIFALLEEECFKGFSEDERQLAGSFLQRMHKNMTEAERQALDKNEETI